MFHNPLEIFRMPISSEKKTPTKAYFVNKGNRPVFQRPEMACFRTTK